MTFQQLFAARFTTVVSSVFTLWARGARGQGPLARRGARIINITTLTVIYYF